MLTLVYWLSPKPPELTPPPPHTCLIIYFMSEGADHGILAIVQAAGSDFASDDEEVHTGVPEVLQRNHNVRTEARQAWLEGSSFCVFL